ncbi:hypothetical protein E2542_SST25107 [Spatholobus suberectus]|nr:hypothetical protein E2542_SST25107 [Spatholobus suberectus]
MKTSRDQNVIVGPQPVCRLCNRLHRRLQRCVRAEPGPQPTSVELQVVRPLPGAHERAPRVHREGGVEGLRGDVGDGGVLSARMPVELTRMWIGESKAHLVLISTGTE